VKQQLCDECIDIIKDNLNMDQVLILRYLNKEKTINPNLSKDKLSIIPNVKGMTDFKFQFSMTGLELVGFVKRNTNKRPNKFYITEDGRKALKMYEESIRETLEDLDE